MHSKIQIPLLSTQFEMYAYNHAGLVKGVNWELNLLYRMIAIKTDVLFYDLNICINTWILMRKRG